MPEDLLSAPTATLPYAPMMVPSQLDQLMISPQQFMNFKTQQNGLRLQNTAQMVVTWLLDLTIPTSISMRQVAIHLLENAPSTTLPLPASTGAWTVLTSDLFVTPMSFFSSPCQMAHKTQVVPQTPLEPTGPPVTANSDGVLTASSHQALMEPM